MGTYYLHHECLFIIQILRRMLYFNWTILITLSRQCHVTMKIPTKILLRQCIFNLIPPRMRPWKKSAHNLSIIARESYSPLQGCNRICPKFRTYRVRHEDSLFSKEKYLLLFWPKKKQISGWRYYLPADVAPADTENTCKEHAIWSFYWPQQQQKAPLSLSLLLSTHIVHDLPGVRARGFFFSAKF